MTVELTPIETGMSKGPEAIQANFETINGALPDTAVPEWKSLASNLPKGWTESSSDTPSEYKIDGAGVWIHGDIKTANAITAGGTSVIYQGLPFTFDGKQKSVQWAVGTSGFLVTCEDGGTSLTFERYHNGDGTNKAVNVNNSFAINLYFAIKQ